MPPLIGLNVDISVKEPKDARIARAYYEAVQEGPTLTVLVPPMPDKQLKRVFDRLDGFVFIGGRDYAPALYAGDANAPYNPLHEIRQDFDVRLCKMALRQKRGKKRMPLLFICGGLQLLNIVRGGSLIEDIPSQMPTALTHSGKGTHPISLVPDSRLARIYRTRRLPFVITSHHQAIGRLGKGLRAVATADDGIIEAVEMEGRDFCVGVQYHPELDHRRELFKAFAKHAKAFARS